MTECLHVKLPLLVYAAKKIVLKNASQTYKIQWEAKMRMFYFLEGTTPCKVQADVSTATSHSLLFYLFRRVKIKSFTFSHNDKQVKMPPLLRKKNSYFLFGRRYVKLFP